jgi:hypothetical protein
MNIAFIYRFVIWHIHIRMEDVIVICDGGCIRSQHFYSKYEYML